LFGLYFFYDFFHKSGKPLTHIEVMETGKKVEKEFSAFMKEIIKEI